VHKHRCHAVGSERFITEELKMKKLAIALTAIAAFSAPALAADMAVKSPMRAPPPIAYAPSWTGCYVGAGGGGAYTNNDHNDVNLVTGFFGPAGSPAGPNMTTGARGWFGTVGAGCDYQFNNFVVGLFGDYDFMDVKGDIAFDGIRAPMVTGSQKQDQQWAVGGRVGYVVLPQLMTYVSGGYTQAHWKNATLVGFGTFFPSPSVVLPGATKGGWFIGAGDEYALNFFLPGLFWKTEYRYSEFDRANVGNFPPPFPGAGSFSMTEKFREHSVRSELVYRFNWGGSVVAKY
jgi:outer membrane immunogenic protein